MKTWTPLWSSILDSTVWSESKDVRLLWITMLAMKDRDGLVESSLVGLSRRAGLTMEETKVAMVVLESPDMKSETNQDHEGRRVKRVEAGWLVLNHLKYRDEISKMRQREQQRVWQANYRMKQRLKNGKPLAGEIQAVAAVDRGATEAEQDAIVTGALPDEVVIGYPNG